MKEIITTNVNPVTSRNLTWFEYLKKQKCYTWRKKNQIWKVQVWIILLKLLRWTYCFDLLMKITKVLSAKLSRKRIKSLKSHLTPHIPLINDGKKPLKCKICDKKFPQYSMIRKHRSEVSATWLQFAILPLKHSWMEKTFFP